MKFDYDVIVIGSGFGGSVTALRLSEKGYRVAVLESGGRWDASDLPRTNWNLRKSIWAPKLGLFGTQRVSVLGKTALFSGAGVGGGSLIYGNTLYKPLPGFYDDPSWADITDWRTELEPYYDQAQRMLGVATNPTITAADEVLREVAEELGVADTFHPTEVGVYFGEPGKTVPDPYFGGAGPDRTGCVQCARCMTGCPHNAKNTTVVNYLYLAEKAGAQVFPMTTVADVRPLSGGGYAVAAQRSGRVVRKQFREFTAEQVVFSAAARGTQQLLHTLKRTGRLPALSPRLGELTRTNSESVLTATSRSRTDFAQGVAITSSIHPEADTHIEVCRYGVGQSVLFPLNTLMTDGGRLRFLRFLLLVLLHPLMFVRSLNLRRVTERSVILLVMQSLDNSLTSSVTRGPFGYRLTTRQGTGAPNPSWIPVGNKANRLFAEKIDGDPHSLAFDVFDIPSTAHYIGGCPMGDSVAEGVIDPYHRIHGYPGLHVIDGSAVAANLGVNPSLTITAMAERACALWPNRGQTDPRPAPGSAYRPVEPVAPHAPAVPSTAPGALRLLPLSVHEPVKQPQQQSN